MNADGTRELLVLRTTGTTTKSHVLQVYNTAKTFKWATTVATGNCSQVEFGQLDADAALEVVYVVDDGVGTVKHNILKAVDGATGALQFTKSLPSGSTVGNLGIVDFNNDGKDEIVYTVLSTVGSLTTTTINVCNGVGTVLWTMTPAHPHPGLYSSISIENTWVADTNVHQVLPDVDADTHRDFLVRFTDMVLPTAAPYQTKMRTVLRLYDTVTKLVKWQGPDMWMIMAPGTKNVTTGVSVANVDSVATTLEIICRYQTLAGTPVLQVFNGRQTTATAVARFTKTFAATSVLGTIPQEIDVNGDGINEVVMSVGNQVQAFNGTSGALVWTLPMTMPSAAYDLSGISLCNARPSTVAGVGNIAAIHKLTDVNADGQLDALVVPTTALTWAATYTATRAQAVVRLYNATSKAQIWQSAIFNDMSVAVAQPAIADADAQDELFVAGVSTLTYLQSVTVLDGKVP